MTTPREHLIHWLKDAYAMEQQALSMTKAQSDRIDHYPQLTARIAEHVEETKGQIDKLERCFAILETDGSMFKNSMGKMAATMQAIGGMMSPDEVVKGSMASYTFEHLEISSYRVLIAAAEAANEPEIARICGEILQEEIAMANWLEEHLAQTTETFLQRDAIDMEEAKR
jgi:ferritin-like metal-binding protein YciE